MRDRIEDKAPPLFVNDISTTGNHRPAWITSELIRQTIKVWQPYYRSRLTADDAVTMIVAVSRMFEVIRRG